MIITFIALDSKGIIIMLQDFYMLELYFGTADSALSVEDLVKKYGESEVRKNISKGYIQVRRAGCASSLAGLSALCWLSDAGRTAVQRVLEL